MNIGILYPRSNAHPELMVDYMDGIKTALKQQGIDKNVQLFSESIGFGGSEKEVYEKAEKLLLLEKVDIIVAYIDLRVAPFLEPLMTKEGKLLVIVNPGANHPDSWVPQEGTLYLTLQHAFLSWLSGSLVQKMENKNGIYATTFYDCGYIHGASMLRAFTTDGGTILFNYINNQAYDKFDIDQLAAFLATINDPTNLLCVMNALPASLFYKLLNELPNADKLNLFVSPMMLQEAALKDIGDGFKFSIDGYLPWMLSQENAPNKAFVAFYNEQVKHEPSIFSLLGWETGLVLKEIIQSGTTDRKKIINDLTTIKIDSPRGALKLDAPTNHFIAPIHKCAVMNNSSKFKTEWLEDINAEWKIFTALPSEGPSSGWSNTYLCY
jgi:branched-chain amino acid transport system substrate-binding protein